MHAHRQLTFALTYHTEVESDWVCVVYACVSMMSRGGKVGVGERHTVVRRRFSFDNISTFYYISI